MTGYIPDDHAVRAGGILYSPVAHESEASSEARKARLYQDTVAEAQEQTHVKQKVLGARAQLPSPNSKISGDELMILATAFCKAFDSMTKGTITETNDYTQLQELDQTQCKAILASTNLAIEKQIKEEKMAAKVAAYDKEMATADSDLGWVMMALGIVLVIVTAASFFVDGGASGSALPEEMEMFDLGGEADASDVSDLSDSSLSEADDVCSDSEMDECSMDETSEEAEQTTTHDLGTTSGESAKSEESWLKKAAKWGLKMTIAAGFGSPMLMKGVIDTFILPGKEKKLAQTQGEVGKAIGLQQRNNMYFRFLQQILQREGGVITEETSDIGEVIETFGAITNAYRSIPQGLANAV